MVLETLMKLYVTDPELQKLGEMGQKSVKKVFSI